MPSQRNAGWAQLKIGIMTLVAFVLLGVMVGESTGGGVAKVRFRDGTTVAGGRIISFTLAASESVRDWFGTAGILFQQGLFFELVGGSVEELLDQPTSADQRCLQAGERMAPPMLPTTRAARHRCMAEVLPFSVCSPA